MNSPWRCRAAAGASPDAKTAAVIGFGSGMSTSVLLALPGFGAWTIEISPPWSRARRISHGEAAYTDSRSRIVIDDAKSYFARCASATTSASQPSNPWVTAASLFSEEFYRRGAT